MLNVMIVDDERLALEGLRLLIDWRKEGFEVCACCCNGEEALAALERVKPNLIVTDLNMPGVDGLTLIRRARERGYTGGFIIVSGYQDFEMARQAMDFKVAGYLLKPIEPLEAAEVIEQARTRLIENELEEEKEIPPYHQALAALLNGEEAKAEELPGARRWRLLGWGAPLSYDRALFLRGLMERENVEISAHICEGQEWLVAHWEEGRPAPEWSELIRALGEDGRALRCSPELDGPGELCQWRRMLSKPDGELERELIDKTVALGEAVSLRQTEEAMRLADELDALCAGEGEAVRRRVYAAAYAGCAQQLAERPEALSAFLKAQNRRLREFCRTAIGLLKPESESVSAAVTRYLDEHYAAQHLVLADAADALGYNASYLGRVFREEAGAGFREALNLKRMEKAAALLATTRESVYSIAETVGYPQYKQFLSHFKARYGSTPEQYRKGITP